MLDFEKMIKEIDEEYKNKGFQEGAAAARTHDDGRRVTADIPANFSFKMYWMGQPCGNLKFIDGFWDFFPDPSMHVSLTESGAGIEGTRVPYFVESLMPETWISTNGRIDSDPFDPNCADRYLSNVVIRPAHRTTPIAVDVLEGRLDDVTAPNGEFVGRISDELIPSITERQKLGVDDLADFAKYAALSNALYAPRISGTQNKLPVHLSPSGYLQGAEDKHFTHIIKFPDERPIKRHSIGSVEWLSLMLARECGLKTERFAITDIPGFGPVFIAERFDIQESGEYEEAIFAEDFSSIMGVRKSERAASDLTDVIQKAYEISTSPEEDVRELLKLVMFSWAIANDDLHLKNMTVLKRCSADLTQVHSVRLSPAYDVISMLAYSNRSEPVMPINRTYDYSPELIEELGESVGIEANEVREMARGICATIEDRLPDILSDLPSSIRAHDRSLHHLHAIERAMQAEDSRLNRLAAYGAAHKRPSMRI